MNSPILAVDSSNNRTSLALVEGDRTRHHAICEVRDNLGWLRQEVDRALVDAGLQVADIARFAVANGPGALTGVRVGVGFVQALAQAAGRPIVGVNTLAAMAWQLRKRCSDAQPLSVALDARMNEIYVAQWVDTAQAVDFLTADDRVIQPQQERATVDAVSVYAGPGWEAYAEHVPATAELVTGVQPDALEVAQLARWAPAQDATVLHVHYLRREVAKVPERLQTAST